MITDVLSSLFDRDLATLKAEIGKYQNEADLWRVDGEIVNSAGNLCLHLSGNLQHFFGTVLGGSAYVRDRDSEFGRRNVPQAELLAEIDAAAESVRSTLAGLTDEALGKTYPIEVFGHPMTTEFFIVHLATHLSYHLGQINYHRRLLSNK